ncbi:MAG TPA: M23 family metallopeptidase [Puia sp.]|nr:M23 family metallopeptidase [Puia sp.]
MIRIRPTAFSAPPFRRRLVLFLSILLAASAAIFYFRSPFSNSYFRQPLDISLQLAANFGELREDHFHMGLDIRTMGREDLPVYAAADGYISHVTIGQYGLGHALFVTHPNGRTTVYGHLNRFFPELSDVIEQRQYAAQRWELELDLPAGRFPIQKGQFIAYSGNTGSSQAPHLHFEIRDTRTGRNINPLLSGFTIPDELPPVIKGLYWYDRRISTYAGRARKIPLTSKEDVYRTSDPVIKLSSPLVSLGISATDKASNSPHLSGIFQAALWLDDSLIHSFRLSDLSYTDTRYINACIDYTKWIRSGIYVQHLSVLPGNHLSIYSSAGKDGLIRLKDTLVHLVHIRVSDVNDNHSDLELKIQLSAPALPGSRPAPSDVNPLASILLQSHSQSAIHPAGFIPRSEGILTPYPGNPLSRTIRLLLPGRDHQVNGPSVRARFSATAFYDQVPFLLSEEPNTGNNRASALVHLHDPTIPVHDRYSVQLRTTLAPGDPLRNRTVMQLVSGDSQSIVKGTWQGDWMSGSFSRLGDLQLLIDTMAPQVQPSGWTDGQVFPANAPALNLICKDEGGMVARFRAELDGHWILFEQKGIQFRYDFDGHCPAGRHRLLVSVTDVAGNETRKTFSFIKQ